MMKESVWNVKEESLHQCFKLYILPNVMVL